MEKQMKALKERIETEIVYFTALQKKDGFSTMCEGRIHGLYWVLDVIEYLDDKSKQKVG